MKLEDLKPGAMVKFNSTGNIFKIEKVTEKRVSWYVKEPYKGGTGKNILKMAWISRKDFERGILKGSYLLPNE